ncbi:MAG: tetratricopeptide repeat protein, partial [Planctomycetes bacterium]|nr:tetratricopeptide repeat protein [Planctomycetota bacterium]
MKSIPALNVVCAILLSTSIAFAQDKEEADAAAKPATVSDAEAKIAEEHFQGGRKLFFQGKYAEAVEKLVKAVDGNPAKTGYKLLLAKAHRYAKQNEKAIGVLEQILKANQDHVEAGIELADLLSPQKQPDRVIAVLEPLLKFKHDYPLYHLLAEAHYEKEQFDKARKYFEEAVKLNPRSKDDHYQLANIYLAQKRFAKSAASYETAGRLGLTSGVYHFKLASAYFNLHNFLGRVTTAKVIGGKPGEIKNNWYLLDPVPGQKDTFYVAGLKSAVLQVIKAQKMGIDIFDIHFLEANIWLASRRYANADKIYAKLE